MLTTRLPAAGDGPRPADDPLRLILDNVSVLVSTVTPTGEIDFANRQLLDYLGVHLEELQDWSRFIHESDRSMVMTGGARTSGTLYLAPFKGRHRFSPIASALGFGSVVQ